MHTRRHFLQLSAAAFAAVTRAQAQPRQPNLIILFTDDMGYSDLSCYGNPVIRTPNLDRMAAEGIRFTSFYSAAPVCTPSRVGLLTGRHPIRAGQPNNTGPDTRGGLPLSEILLPQVLKKIGYRTMAIGKWHLGHQPKEQLPISRGFDEWFGLPYSNDMIPPWVQTKVPLRVYRNADPVEESPDQSNLTERYTAEALRFIKASGNQPFFLYMPYNMPHLPVSAGSRAGQSRAGLYGDVVETLDWSVGEILRTLKEQRIDNNTLVCFASDNGPWHNLPPRMLAKGVEPWHTGTKGVLRGSKGTSYEGGQRVPGIMRWPGVIAPGQVTADPGSTLDLFPTLVSAAGGTMPSDRKYDGFDLMPFLRQGGRSPRNEFYYCVGKTLEGVREGPWKYRKGRSGGSEGKPELFHLDWDPAEMYNLHDRHPDITARLSEKLKKFAAEIGADVVV
ncbi:MAG: sulfatase [Acidobacteria bacterium]|nr:sulfatase [Acidobacteriota bacterium]